MNHLPEVWMFLNSDSAVDGCTGFFFMLYSSLHFVKYMIQHECYSIFLEINIQAKDYMCGSTIASRVPLVWYSNDG